MKETAISAKIVAKLNDVYGCRARKRHSGVFSGGGEPDISGVYLGHAFFLEMKMLNGQLTELQAATLEAWREAGASTFVGIYAPLTRLLAVVELHDTEKWPQFTGPHGVYELWKTSAVQKTKLSEYPFSGWLDKTVAQEQFV